MRVDRNFLIITFSVLVLILFLNLQNYGVVNITGFAVNGNEKPDLIVSSVYYSRLAPATPGYYVEITNIGNADLTVPVNFTLQNEQSDEFFEGTYPFSSEKPLRVGEDFVHPMFRAKELEKGTYDITLFVDPKNQISEQNEENNQLTKSISITCIFSGCSDSDPNNNTYLKGILCLADGRTLYDECRLRFWDEESKSWNDKGEAYSCSANTNNNLYSSQNPTGSKEDSCVVLEMNCGLGSFVYCPNGCQDGACIQVSGANYPSPFSTSGATIVIGANAPGSDLVSAVKIANDLVGYAGLGVAYVVADKDLTSADKSRDLIVVGNSCNNSVAAKLLESDVPKCGAEFTSLTGISENQAIIKVFANPYASGKIAMLIAGYNATDTTKAVNYVLAAKPSTAGGTQICLSTSTTLATAVTCGVVQPPTGTCTDSDDGMNYYVKGDVSSCGIVQTDFCASPTPGADPRVIEFYCSGVSCNPSIGEYGIESTEYVCPNGCQDGVCIQTAGANYPAPFTTSGATIIIGSMVPGSDLVSAVKMANDLVGYNGPAYVVRDTAMTSADKSKDLIVVGNSCDNAVAAKILGSDVPKCGADFTALTGVGQNQAIIKMVSNPYTASRIAMLIAGYGANDTTKAVSYVIANKPSTAVGTQIKLNTATDVATATNITITQPPTGACTENDVRYYSCPDGTQVQWCTCLNAAWQCILSPESVCAAAVPTCQGCYIDETTCKPVGSRFKYNFGSEEAPNMIDSYCEGMSAIRIQGTSGSSCDDNYKCLSNYCGNGICVNIEAKVNLLIKIVCTILHPINDENYKQCLAGFA